MVIENIIVTNKGYKDLNPVSYGYQKCKSSYAYGPALRMYWIIHYVVSGCGIFKINNKTYTVKAGEMFVIPPLVETYYEADKKRAQCLKR